MDSNGYIRIVGRTKEIIIRGGINIYPKEIEDMLITHPKINFAAVSTFRLDRRFSQAIREIQLFNLHLG